MKATPSPRPWRLRKALTEHRTPIIEDSKFTGVCYIAINRRIEDRGPSEQEQVNAEHIIKAVNMHDELVAALAGCIDSQDCNGYIGVQMLEEARAALAKVQA